MAGMTVAQFGMILSAMSTYAKERADQRREHLGKENTELLFALGHTLHSGAEAALVVAERARKDEMS